MFIFDYLIIIAQLLGVFSAGIGAAILFLAFFADMEIVYKAKILGTTISRTTKLLDRIAWGYNGLYTVFRILTNRRQLYRLIALTEAEVIPTPTREIGGLRYRSSPNSYSPMEGTVLLFYATSEEEGEPLYVLRPFVYLADDWKMTMGGGI